MKEINFHDGGMPIHLDDLKLLQNFSKDIVLLLIKSLVGDKVEAFAMNLPKVKRAPEGGVVVSPGAMYADGDILSWNETRIADVIEGMPIYACIREVTSDNLLQRMVLQKLTILQLLLYLQICWRRMWSKENGKTLEVFICIMAIQERLVQEL